MGGAYISHRQVFREGEAFEGHVGVAPLGGKDEGGYKVKSKERCFVFGSPNFIFIRNYVAHFNLRAERRRTVTLSPLRYS